MKKLKILQKLSSGSSNVTFDELVIILNTFGFIEERCKGSHHIFKKDGI